jgi:glycerol dehydrogenase
MLSMGFPAIYQQGPGLIHQIGELVAGFGKRPLVVLDPLVKERFAADLEASLSAKSIRPEYFSFEGELCPEVIERITIQARDTGCDFALGMGGGKVLDASKAAKLKLGLPLVLFPTIASNDAPTSRLIITYNADGTFLGPLFLDRNPEAVLVDTAIIAAAPRRFLVAGMGDALATWFEAKQCHLSGVGNFFGGLPGETVLNLAKLCYQLVRRHGEAAVASLGGGGVSDDLEKIVEANVLLSGIGFEGCGVAAAHAFSQGFSQIPQLHGCLHGEEVAVGLIAQLALEDRPDEYILDLLGFYQSIGLPGRLEDLGLAEVTEHDLKIIAEFASRPGSRMHNMSFMVTPDTATAALKRAAGLAHSLDS